MRPEGGYSLDLSRWEERLVAKALCALETKEPGANWLTYSFQWDTEPEPMPGWELTQPWLTAEGMPDRGVFTVQYYGGEGKGLGGCIPNVGFRRALLHMVLMHEADIVEDEVADATHSPTDLEALMLDQENENTALISASASLPTLNASSTLVVVTGLVRRVRMTRRSLRNTAEGAFTSAPATPSVADKSSAKSETSEKGADAVSRANTAAPLRSSFTSRSYSSSSRGTGTAGESDVEEAEWKLQLAAIAMLGGVVQQGRVRAPRPALRSSFAPSSSGVAGAAGGGTLATASLLNRGRDRRVTADGQSDGPNARNGSGVPGDSSTTAGARSINSRGERHEQGQKLRTTSVTLDPALLVPTSSATTSTSNTTANTTHNTSINATSNASPSLVNPQIVSPTATIDLVAPLRSPSHAAKNLDVDFAASEEGPCLLEEASAAASSATAQNPNARNVDRNANANITPLDAILLGSAAMITTVPPPQLTRGQRYLLAYPQQWLEYFYPNAAV